MLILALQNVAANDSRLSVDEFDYGDDLSGNDWRMMVQLEKKRVLLMNDIIPKFSKSDQLVRTDCGYTFYSKACLLLDKHRSLVERGQEVSGLQKAMASRV